MTRILHVITDDRRRGAQVFGLALAERLTEVGLPSTSVALTGGGPGGLDVEVLGRRARGPGTLRALRARMAAADITVAHGSATLQACGLSGLGGGRPFVYRQISDPVYWSSGGTRRWRTRGFYRLPHHVVSLSERTKAALVSRFGLDPARVTVIPNGVDERTHPLAGAEARALARQHLDLPVGRPVVAYAGALVEEKGVFDLLAAIEPAQILVMAGDGPARASLEGEARRRRIELRMLGSVDDLDPLYAACDVLALPSWSEQQPAVVLEAALVGAPVVASRVGLLDELVVDGVTGRLVAPKQPGELRAAIGEVLAQPDAGRGWGAAGREHVLTRFSLEQVSASWAALLRALAG